MNEKLKELREVNMATGIVKVFTELMSTVLNGRADVDFKVIIFTFGIDFFPLFNKTGLHTFIPFQTEARGQGHNYWQLSDKWEQTFFNFIKS